MKATHTSRGIIVGRQSLSKDCVPVETVKYKKMLEKGSTENSLCLKECKFSVWQRFVQIVDEEGCSMAVSMKSVQRYFVNLLKHLNKAP